MSNTVETPPNLSEVVAIRREKLAEWRAQGQAFPNDFKREHLSADIHHAFASKTKEQLAEKPTQVTLAGRMMLRRLMGKASFVHMQDMTGRMQLYVRKDDLPEGVYEAFLHWDLGDIIGVEGYLFRTKTDELTVHVENIRLLTKALQPPPDKFHGLVDRELCYRQRYVDLMANEKTRACFFMRSKLVSAIRQYLTDHRFLEVETPMLQCLPGGAAARPFVTFHHTLDMEMYLRIAPELYLKRLVVGGFERVFEINRNFRNEGLSTQHNPEFTMLEFYQAYADYQDLMHFTEAMFRHLALTCLGTTVLSYQGQEIDFAKPFARYSLLDSILYYHPEIKKSDLEDEQKARALAEKLGIAVQDVWGLGKVQTEIFEKVVEHQLTQPTFITDYPAEVSPLARRNSKNPFITDRFELFIAGREIANGFSELNDPEDQAERFREQVKCKQAGDLEAMCYDEDYITALEYGLPPTAGEGIGIDRLVMLFTDAPSIREVILFPHMRNK